MSSTIKKKKLPTIRPKIINNEYFKKKLLSLLNISELKLQKFNKDKITPVVILQIQKRIKEINGNSLIKKIGTRKDKHKSNNKLKLFFLKKLENTFITVKDRKREKKLSKTMNNVTTIEVLVSKFSKKKIDRKVTIERLNNKSIPSINGIIEKLSNFRNFFFLLIGFN